MRSGTYTYTHNTIPAGSHSATRRPSPRLDVFSLSIPRLEFCHISANSLVLEFELLDLPPQSQHFDFIALDNLSERRVGCSSSIPKSPLLTTGSLNERSGWMRMCGFVRLGV